jgi:hypothetical protein
VGFLASGEQVAEKGKSLKCGRELRDVTLERFRLPGDGREWKHSARNRQALAAFLATFANADGSRVRPSIPTMCEHFGFHKATVCRLLAALEALGFQKRVGRFGGKNGVAIRQLNVAALEVANSNLSESQSHESESQTPESESQSQLSKSHSDATLPPALPPTDRPPPPPKEKSTTDGGGNSLSQEHPRLAFGKESELDALIQEHGFAVVANALHRLEKEDYDGVKNIVAAVFAPKGRLPQRIAEEKIKQAAAVRERAERDAIEANISRQKEELIRRNHGGLTIEQWNKKQAAEAAEAEEFFKEFQNS